MGRIDRSHGARACYSFYRPLAPFLRACAASIRAAVQGKLFDILRSVRPGRSFYGPDLKAEDIGDGPAVYVMFILVPVAVGLATWLEIALTPLYWLHLAIWPSMGAVSKIAFMAPKGNVDRTSILQQGEGRWPHRLRTSRLICPSN